MPSIHHLYVHIPFCAKICPYCSFYVLKGGKDLQDSFVEALIRELHQAQAVYDLPLETVYLGGGTPSLLSPELFRRFSAALPTHQPLEFTLEANPATVTPAKADAWKAAGVNRISLGAQSFDSDYLKLLGRQHAPADIPATMAELRAAGFSNINIDLMFALPQQPLETWQTTLEAALSCQPDHLSAYGLTYEEDTPFFEKLRLGEWKTDENREIAMFTSTRDRLAAAGLPGYEISNFARPGCESIHNRAYWSGKDYLGLGPSATSTIGTQRWKNVPDTAAYIARLESGESLQTEVEDMTSALRRKEQIMFGLRTREGIPEEWLEFHPTERTQLIEEGLIESKNQRLILTARGRLVADSVAGIFA